MPTYQESLRAARADHVVSLDSPNGWICSCGRGAQPRMLPPSRPMSQAAADRHIEAVARKIRMTARTRNEAASLVPGATYCNGAQNVEGPLR